MIIDIVNPIPEMDSVTYTELLEALCKGHVESIWAPDIHISGPKAFWPMEPSKEDLQAAIDRHVAKSTEVVARIPFHMRTIISKWELKNAK